MRYTKRNFRKHPKNRLKKRWYFNAGANLPFVGKTNVSFGSGGNFKRSVINVVRNGLEDPLHKLYSKVGTSPPTIASMLHNTMYSLNLTGNIPQGTTDNSRIGDTIHLEAFKFTLNFFTTTSTNINTPKEYRVILSKCDIDAGAASDAWGSYIGATDMFHGNNLLPYEKVNSKSCTVIYDKRVKAVPTIASTGTIMTIDELIPLKTKFVYKTGTNYGKTTNYYLVVCGSDPQGTTGTTVIGGVQLFGDLIFKDCK